MSNNTHTQTSKHETKQEATQEVKEIDYSITTAGPLFVPERLKKPGFVYCFVSNKPGEIEMYQRWGYEVIKEDNVAIGDSKPKDSSPFGAALTVQSKCGQLLVLMAITEELHKKLMAFRDSQNKKLDSAIGRIDGVPSHMQYGDITRDGRKY